MKAPTSEPAGESDIPPARVMTKERVRFPIVITLAGQRYCILPGWQPLAEKFLCLPVG